MPLLMWVGLGIGLIGMAIHSHHVEGLGSLVFLIGMFKGD
jgi:hypothetical protein